MQKMMMMKTRMLLAATLFTVVSFAQTAHTDSIKAFQKKYVTELYPIIKADTAYIRFYPINALLKVQAKVELLTNQQPFKLVTSSGKTKEAEKYALLSFTINGKQHQLFAYQLLQLKNNPATSKLVFVPFTDATSGDESYHGGRYMDFETTDIKNGMLAIDFNKAYNPYCAFTTGYNCPIPPKENTLAIPIKAGESYMQEKFKH
jgi:uncharacterized protein (DUF1684 family)